MKCFRTYSLTLFLRKSYFMSAVILSFSCACVNAKNISSPDWAIAVANEKCNLWREKGYDYYEVRKHMEVEWGPEFEKEFSLLPYQEALDLSREVTGAMCPLLQDNAWEKFRDRQSDTEINDLNE
jgi:hypothetical protein